jgi:WD40 repeat protein
VDTGRELATFCGHTFHVFTVAFHPDGRRILSGGSDGVVKVWDVQRSRPVIYDNQPDWVTGAAFSRDGRLVATEWDPWRQWLYTMTAAASSDKAQKLRKIMKVITKFWDPETGEEVSPPTAAGADSAFGPFNRLNDLTVSSPDGRFIAKVEKYDSPNDVLVIDSTRGRGVFTLVGHTGPIACMAFSPDGRRIATASLDRTVKLWDSDTGQEVLTLRGHTANSLCVAFSPDGHRLASGSSDLTARIWDARPLAPGDLPADSSTR